MEKGFSFASPQAPRCPLLQKIDARKQPLAICGFFRIKVPNPLWVGPLHALFADTPSFLNFSGSISNYDFIVRFLIEVGGLEVVARKGRTAFDTFCCTAI